MAGARFTGGLQAERTHLAWLRTIVAAFVLAAVVGRIQVGTALALVGIAPPVVLVGAVVVRSRILTEQRPRAIARWLTALIAASVVITSGLLAAVIIFHVLGSL